MNYFKKIAVCFLIATIPTLSGCYYYDFLFPSGCMGVSEFIADENNVHLVDNWSNEQIFAKRTRQDFSGKRSDLRGFRTVFGDTFVDSATPAFLAKLGPRGQVRVMFDAGLSPYAVYYGSYQRYGVVVKNKNDASGNADKLIDWYKMKKISDNVYLQCDTDR